MAPERLFYGLMDVQSEVWGRRWAGFVVLRHVPSRSYAVENTCGLKADCLVVIRV